jgi:hypothetical protein
MLSFWLLNLFCWQIGSFFCLSFKTNVFLLYDILRKDLFSLLTFLLAMFDRGLLRKVQVCKMSRTQKSNINKFAKCRFRTSKWVEFVSRFVTWSECRRPSQIRFSTDGSTKHSKRSSKTLEGEKFNNFFIQKLST